jgi:hypothetical protein
MPAVNVLRPARQSKMVIPLGFKGHAFQGILKLSNVMKQITMTTCVLVAEIMKPQIFSSKLLCNLFKLSFFLLCYFRNTEIMEISTQNRKRNMIMLNELACHKYFFSFCQLMTQGQMQCYLFPKPLLVVFYIF